MSERPHGRGAEGQETAPSFIGPDLVIRGRLTSTGDLFVSGRVDGEVTCRHLSILRDGWVDGTVACAHLGAESGAILDGRAAAHSLGIKAGARINAALSTLKPDAPVALPRSRTPPAAAE